MLQLLTIQQARFMINKNHIVYVIAARIKTGSVPRAIYLDTGDQKSKNTVPPYHYIRIQKNMDNNDYNYDLLII
jgi:hypothetical protein